MIPAAQDAIKKHCLQEVGEKVRIELSQFGADASLIGAIAIVADNILSNPTHMERR
jgi:hypothetical protein